MTDDSWLTRLTHPTLHIHWGWVNLKSILTWILQLATVRIKMGIVWFTKTCVISLQHIPVNLPSNNCQSCITRSEIWSSCHHKLYPEDRNTARLHHYASFQYLLHSRIHSQARTRASKWPCLGCRLCRWTWSPTAQTVNARVSWILKASIRAGKRRTSLILADWMKLS